MFNKFIKNHLSWVLLLSSIITSYILSQPLLANDLQWNPPIRLGVPINLGGWIDMPWVTPDGNTLYFVYYPGLESARPGAVRPGNNGNNNFDFYISSRNSDGTWSIPVSTHSTNVHETSISISSDGKTIYLARSRPSNLYTLSIFVIHKNVDGTWPAAVELGTVINNPTIRVDMPCISPDNKTLYFGCTTDLNATSEAGFDIWMSTRENVNNDFAWGNPIKLSTQVNTGNTDFHPFMCPDNKTLYFASRGQPGVDKLSIFCTIKQGNNNWSSPVLVDAMKYFDSPNFSAEGAPSLTADGQTLYFGHVEMPPYPDGPGLVGTNISVWMATRIVTTQDYSISGYVKDNSSNPLSGFMMTLSGDKSSTTVTNVSGYYAFTISTNSYMVSLSSANWRFSPSSRNYSAISSSQANQNFFGTYNSAPILSWTGESGYLNDGINPEVGTATTTVIYRVKYTDYNNDAPASGYPKVHVLKSNTEISGSPFVMTTADSIQYNSGRVYTYPTLLARGTDYTYYFEAYDITGGTATGITALLTGPAVQTFYIISSSASVAVNTQKTVQITPETGVIKVQIPVQTFADTVIINISTATISEVYQENLRPTNIGIEINIDKQLQPVKEITITLNYRDIDIIGLNELKFVICRYDESNLRWVPIPSQRYPDQNYIEGRTAHLSKFAIMQLNPSADIQSVKVYPNPFNPVKHTQGLTISNLTERADICIYTVAGELVKKLEERDGDGLVVWDGKNMGEKYVGNGVFILIIKSGDDIQRKKIVVIK
ncbi:MAG: T9SS type A sorting domain-containing protein [Elusimicrobiota bacterium]